MSRCRVVVPEIVRLPLSEGDFIDVRRRLNAGEHVEMLSDLASRKHFVKILAFVVGWSFVGLNEQPLPYDVDAPEATRRDTLKALEPEAIREMVAVIDRHEAAEEKARAEKKTVPAGGPASSPTSTSPDAAAGPSPTSAS
jgi:hypothetical protein